MITLRGSPCQVPAFTVASMPLPNVILTGHGWVDSYIIHSPSTMLRCLVLFQFHRGMINTLLFRPACHVCHKVGSIRGAVGRVWVRSSLRLSLPCTQVNYCLNHATSEAKHHDTQREVITKRYFRWQLNPSHSTAKQSRQPMEYRSWFFLARGLPV